MGCGRTRGTQRSAGSVAGPSRGYREDLSSVRRQRVQTSALIGAPFRSMTSGCRFGCMRRWARTRFEPDDCGLKPPIETLPQIAQERAIVFLGMVVRGKRIGLEGPSGAV